MEEEREATVMKDDGKAIDSATVAMNKVEQREAEESKVPQKKVAVKEEDSTGTGTPLIQLASIY